MAEENTLIRVGKVSSVDKNKLMARVFYPSMSNMVSDWLPVLQHPGSVSSAGSHSHTDSMGGGTSAGGGHSHTKGSWLPNVNDRVLVIMEYGFNSQGYIAGVIP